MGSRPESAMGTRELQVMSEGDVIPSCDYRFCRIGEALSIAAAGDSIYDSDNPPAQPLAVSQRSRLLFIAHSDGFYVARTKEVMAAAAAFKEKGSSVHDLSTINISSIGRVSILALSSLDSWLAASVDNHINFFSMSALLHKDHHPSFSAHLDQSVKDLKWAPDDALEKHYLALSTAGTLYRGSGPAPPDTLRTNVDAVEWSANGQFIALAQSNIITILTSKYEEKTSFALSPASITVDSIRWVSAGKIILGGFEEDSSYVVQVISTQGDKEITNISLQPSTVVFHEMFISYQCDTVSRATGPSLFVSYLENCELAIVANRNNVSDHIVILGEDANREAAMLESTDDAWRPYICSQENGDDNMILALSVDKVSHDEKMKVIVGEERNEVSPSCVLLCVTIDGKISLFHVASAADKNSSRKDNPDTDGEQDEHLVLSENRLEKNMLHSSLTQEYEELIKVKPCDIQGNSAVSVNNIPSLSSNSSKLKEKSSLGSQTQLSAISFQEARDGTLSSINLKVDRGTQPSPKDSLMNARDVWKAETPAASEAKAYTDVMSEKLSTNFTSQSESKSIPAYESSLKNRLPDPRIAAPSSSLRNSFPLGAVDNRSISSSTFGGVSQSPSQSVETSVPVSRLHFSGPKAAAMVDNRSSSPAYCNSQAMSQQNIVSGKFVRGDNLIASSYPERSNHEQKLSSQFSNVEVLVQNMVQNMDQLLEDIHVHHGFMGASITSQEGSVAALEQGLSMMSEQCRMWRGTLEGRLEEIQHLFDKTMQVKAKKVYMEGIFRQANDNLYSELWNSQKLCLELDLKRQHIVEVDQELASQLVQLERHFNTIELNKFGENTVFQEKQKAIRGGYGKPRQQSLRSLQNTISAQLDTAEKLSLCLSEQMAVLNLQSQDSKQNVKREVFETLGLTYDGAYNSSVKGKATDSPGKDLMINSSSLTAKKLCRTPVKNSEPQTVRRQRKSLEQMKSSSVLEKVTVKRILLQEDHRNRENSKVKDVNLRLVSPVSYGFLEVPEKSEFQYKSKISSKIPAKQSWKFAGKASGNDAEYAQQSENSRSDLPSSISERTLVSTTSTKSPRLSNGLGTFGSAKGEVKATPVHVSQGASVSSGFSSPLHLSGRVLETEFSAGETRPGQKISFPALQLNTSASNQVSSSATSTPFPNMTSGLKSHDKDLSSSSQAKLDTDQKKLQSHSLFSSSSQFSERVSHLSSTPTFSKESSETPKSGSQPTVDVFGTSSCDVTSMKQKVISSSSLPTEEMPKAETPVLLHGLPNDSSSSTSTVSGISSAQSADLPVIQKTENQPNLEVPVSEMKPNSTHGQPVISGNSSLAPIFSDASLMGENLANNEEDEMEEEAPETPELTLGNLGGFGFGSSSSNATKPNPFGVEMINKSVAPVAMTTPAGELFRPASFNLQSAFPSQPSVAANTSLFTSGFGSGSSSVAPSSSGFGQPAQFGSGQQALGSVLGAFGQSRQLGASPPGNSIVPTIGGFSSVGSATGGFASLSAGAGFGAVAMPGGFAAAGGGGFAAAAGTARGGFAAAAGTGGGGFAAAAGTGGGGFAAAAGTGGGFTAAGTGTGGAFGNQGGGFSAFGNSSGAGAPPSNLFTQMRK